MACHMSQVRGGKESSPFVHLAHLCVSSWFRIMGNLHLPLPLALPLSIYHKLKHCTNKYLWWLRTLYKDRALTSLSLFLVRVTPVTMDLVICHQISNKDASSSVPAQISWWIFYAVPRNTPRILPEYCEFCLCATPYAYVSSCQRTPHHTYIVVLVLHTCFYVPCGCLMWLAPASTPMEPHEMKIDAGREIFHAALSSIVWMVIR